MGKFISLIVSAAIGTSIVFGSAVPVVLAIDRGDAVSPNHPPPAVQQKQQQAQGRKEAAQQKRAETKAEIADRAIKELNRINVHISDRKLHHLDQLSKVLKKISDRADKAAANSKDVTAVRTAIAAAQSAIDTAIAAAKVQKAKVYNIDPSAADLKAAVKAQREQMRKDQEAVHLLIKAAREKVRAAHKALKAVRGENEDTTMSPASSVNENNSNN